MTFLKQLGIDIVTAIGKIAPFLPILKMVTPSAAPVIDKIDSELTQFAGIVANVEAISTALSTPNPGAVKLQQAIPAVGQVVAQSALLVGKTIANQALYNQALQEYAQATVDLMNSLQAQPAAAAVAPAA
jgi:hypothetical protein